MPFSERQQQEIARLMRILAIEDKDRDLFCQALTRPCPSRPINYDRLEFLGDRVLRYAVGNYLYDTYPHATVYEMCIWEESLINNEFLAKVGKTLSLNIIASSNSPKRLADMVEAIIAVIDRVQGPAQVAWFTRFYLLPLCSLPDPAELTEKIELQRENDKAVGKKRGRWEQLTTLAGKLGSNKTVLDCQPLSDGQTDRFRARVVTTQSQFDEIIGEAIANDQAAAKAAAIEEAMQVLESKAALLSFAAKPPRRKP